MQNSTYIEIAWIWFICTSIYASFNPEVNYGFKCNFGQIVLSQCQTMCIFWTIYDIYYEIVRKIHIIGHCERTICPKWHLKPYLSSGTKDTSIEIHVDHIHRLFLKNVLKFCICWFLPNWLWNFLYRKFFHVFFFKLFTIESFTKKQRRIKFWGLFR